MSAHPYKAAMLDQLAAQADRVIRQRRVLLQIRDMLDELRAERVEAMRPLHRRLLARIRAWWPL
jgi:hypothetical protein